jgi:hypothetical protein
MPFAYVDGDHGPRDPCCVSLLGAPHDFAAQPPQERDIELTATADQGRSFQMGGLRLCTYRLPFRSLD